MKQSPADVLRYWHQALQDTNTAEDIYFKIQEGCAPRWDIGVVYVGKDAETQEAARKALMRFTEICPPALLPDTPMPTGVPLKKGISYATDPKNINDVLKAMGANERVSYNSLLSSVWRLSFELSQKDATETGMTDPTPKKLKPQAQEYFTQMLHLAGINPETMVSNRDGGELPAWAKHVAA